ncbi:MAG: hypothetical protein WKF58_11460 [Ilumatobacteraceae bacterium]
MRATVERVALTPGGGAVLSAIVAQGHARVIGLREQPVRIGPRLLVEATRDERVAVLPAVTLPIEKIMPISIIRESTDWLIPIAAIAGAVLMLIGLVVHPVRADALFGLGSLFVFVGLMLVLVAYVVPVAIVPALDDSTWTAAIPIIAKENANTVFLGAGGSCSAASPSSSARRPSAAAAPGAPPSRRRATTSATGAEPSPPCSFCHADRADTATIGMTERD